ncbi:MAG: hypothetical protein IT244_08990 [Bacteroidia bacterium]|nr:hypothetical protein [Bacteroidia bacterium]
MRNLQGKIIIGFAAMLLWQACSKEKKVTFGVVPEVVYEDKARKNKRKSDAEYISILYTNLYQVPISPNQLYRTQNTIFSIGDRNVASELVLSNYFNTQTLKIPTNTDMRSNIDSFVTNTYKRFFLRYPSEGEKTFFKNYITNNNNVTVEMVYTAFASSDEYQYY